MCCPDLEGVGRSKDMATVNILISDQPDGLFIKLTSDEPMPKDDEDGGSIAQNAGLSGLNLNQDKAASCRQYK